MRRWIYWGLTVLIALLTGTYVYLYLDAAEDVVPVVVAARDVPVFHRMEGDDVVVRHIHRSALHPRAARVPKEVVGSKTLEPLYAGEQVLAERLTEGDSPALGVKLKAEERLMFIPVGRDEAVSARLERGDVVDVYFFTDELALGGEARLLLSRLRVVEVCEQAGLRGASSELLGVITEVTPAQAAVLVYALESGEVYLALAAHNATPVEVQPVTRSRLLLEADGHTREKQQLPGVIP